MSQKAELPSLTGHRTKTRKRDEKKVTFLGLEIWLLFGQVYDPSGFRDEVIKGLEGKDNNEEVRLGQIWKAHGKILGYQMRNYLVNIEAQGVKALVKIWYFFPLRIDEQCTLGKISEI